MTSDVADDVSGITGVLGGRWRADVTPHGSVVPWDGSPPLDWHVAADDRWHHPAKEAAVRQRRLLGAPVYETRLRVPSGDAVARVWSVADGGGLTVFDVENDSPLPIACAITRDDLLTARPTSAAVPGGLELTGPVTLLPIGHRASARAVLGHDGAGPGRLPPTLAAPDAVARGWVVVVERAGRLDLPDAALAEAVVAARCDLLLGDRPPPDDDPVGFLLATAELVRLDEPVDDDGPEIAAAAQRVASQPGWDVDAALAAAGRVLAAAGEDRAVGDLARIVASRSAEAVPDVTPRGVRAVAAVEGRLVRDGVLFPDGLPPTWRGADLEAHRLPAGPRSTVSFAVRWHGRLPAVLWQVDGPPVMLSAPALDPDWRTTEPSGEALWRYGST